MHYKYGFCYTTTYIKTILKKQVNRQIQRKKSFKCPKRHTQKKQLSQRCGISKKQIILDCSLCRTPFYAAVIPRNVGETLGRQEGTLCNPPLFPQLSQNNVISSVLYSNPGFLIRWKEGLRKEFWNLVSEYWNKGVLRGFFLHFLKINLIYGTEELDQSWSVAIFYGLKVLSLSSLFTNIVELRIRPSIFKFEKLF